MDIGQDINENVSTNEICSWFETDQSQSLAVLCVLWALPSQSNPRVLLGNCLRMDLGCRSVLGHLGLRRNLLFWSEIVSFGVFCELPCQASPRISLGNILGLH